MLSYRLLLQVDGKINMCDPAIAKRGAACQVSDLFNMGRAHDSRIVDSDIHKDAIQINILLRMRIDEVVIMVAGDSQDGLAVQLCVVKSVQQMNASRTGGRQTHTEPARVFSITAGHEGGGFFMPNLNETNMILALSQRLHDSVDAVARQSEDDVNSPIK